MYIYCLVSPEGYDKEFYYISDSEDIRVNDVVIVPFGVNNKELLGMVTSVELYEESNTPYPPSRTKRIIKRVDPAEASEIAETFNEVFTYCLVKPTGMTSSYYYISESDDIVTGDVVVIPFGPDDHQLFGRVSLVKRCKRNNAPHPLESTKRILRKADPFEKSAVQQAEAEEYIYCWVIPEGKSESYNYISETADIKKGDMVVVPFGSSNREIIGKVSMVKRLRAVDAPYPPSQTKKILRKVDAEMDYEYLVVLPITHKKKTFGYINTLSDVHVGDYVDIDFRGVRRVAHVLEIKTGAITAAPDNFMGTMEVLRKLTYENSDFIRFITDLKPLFSIDGALYRDDSDECRPYRRSAYSPMDGTDIQVPDSRLCSLRDRIISIPQSLLSAKEKEQFRLKPRLTKQAVETFEHVYQVKLPEEYKYFIIEFSNGFLGIRGLNVEEFDKDYIYLRHPFILKDISKFYDYCDPIDAAGIECEEYFCSECKYREICPSSDCYNDDEYGWLDERYLAGTLMVYNSGGDNTDHMVVDGENAGTVFCKDDYMAELKMLSTSFMDYAVKYIDARLRAITQNTANIHGSGES